MVLVKSYGSKGTGKKVQDLNFYCKIKNTLPQKIGFKNIETKDFLFAIKKHMMVVTWF